jgi:hypothetical protein
MVGLKRAAVSTAHWFWPPGNAEWWKQRLSIRADLAWQPFLFTAVWWGACLTMILRILDIYDVDPPGKSIDSIEGIWLYGALSFPVVGYISVQVIQNGRGKWLYGALWCRLAADIGVATSLFCFMLREAVTDEAHPFMLTIMAAAVLFLTFLTVRDIKFLVATERLANYLARRDDEGR